MGVDSLRFQRSAPFCASRRIALRLSVQHGHGGHGVAALRRRRTAWARATSAWCSAATASSSRLLALPVAARIEAAGPFRWLGAAALLVAAAPRLLCGDSRRRGGAARRHDRLQLRRDRVQLRGAGGGGAARARRPARRLPGRLDAGRARFSMGSALFVSGLLRDAAGMARARGSLLRPCSRSRPAWRCYRFAAESDSRNATRSVDLLGVRPAACRMLSPSACRRSSFSSE